MNAEVIALQQPMRVERDLRAEVAALQSADQKLTQAEIARQSGIGATRINQWLKGIYPGDNAALELDVARWVDAYRERQLQARALPEAPSWVSTPSGERVLAALGYAQVAGDIAVVYGGAGLGKTTAIKRYQLTSPNVWHATMSSATAGVVPALEEVADAVGLRDISGGGSKLQRHIMQKLRGTHGLLCIDEAQHLNVQALDAMRALHDATGIGLALVGNETVYARMTGGNRAAYLDRLYSRIGKRVRLIRSTREDVEAILGIWSVHTKDCRALLHDIAAKPGGLRGITKVLRLASMLAAGAKADVNCDHIKAAWRDLGGE